MVVSFDLPFILKLNFTTSGLSRITLNHVVILDSTADYLWLL